MIRRVGKGGDTQKSWRVCSNHPIVPLRESIGIVHKGKISNQRFEFQLIIAAGNASSLNPSETTKGVVRDRLALNILNSSLHVHMKEKQPHQD